MKPSINDKLEHFCEQLTSNDFKVYLIFHWIIIGFLCFLLIWKSYFPDITDDDLQTAYREGWNNGVDSVFSVSPNGKLYYGNQKYDRENFVGENGTYEKGGVNY